MAYIHRTGWLGGGATPHSLNVMILLLRFIVLMACFHAFVGVIIISGRGWNSGTGAIIAYGKPCDEWAPLPPYSPRPVKHSGIDASVTAWPPLRSTT